MIEQVEKLKDIVEPYAGQTVWCSSEDKVYRFDPVEGWQHVPEDGTTSIGMNIYDMNRQIIGQLAPLTDEELAKKKALVRAFITNTKNKYYMLLCRDINYYTIFAMDIYLNTNDILEDVMFDECITKYLGDIKAVEITEDGGAIEIWYTAHDDTYVMYFFPYDAGVVLCK